MGKWICTHYRQIITLCLLLVLMALVGHFLADVSDFSIDSMVTLDLHGNFLLNFTTELVKPRTALIPCLLSPILFRYCIAPPTPPPPISSLV